MLHSDDTRGLGLVSFQAFFPPIKQEKSECSNTYLTFDEEVLRPFMIKPDVANYCAKILC